MSNNVPNSFDKTINLLLEKPKQDLECGSKANSVNKLREVSQGSHNFETRRCLNSWLCFGLSNKQLTTLGDIIQKD